MNNQTWPWPFVGSLIQRFGLNECEAGDLSDRAQRFLDAGLGWDTTSRALIVERLRVWASILFNEGSSMQPTWDMLARAKNELSQNPHKSSQTMNL